MKGCENMVPTTIFVSMGEQVVTEDCRKLHSEELRDLYYLSDQIKHYKLERICSTRKGHDS
jgi:hypothetical protein